MGIYIPGMAHQKVFHWFYCHITIPIQERNNKKKNAINGFDSLHFGNCYLMALGSASPAVFVINNVSSKQDLFSFFLSSGLQPSTGKLESIPTQSKGCLQCLKLKTKCSACELKCHFSLFKISPSLFSIHGWLGGGVGGGLMGMENGYMHGGMKDGYGDVMHASGFMYIRNNWNEMKVG